MQDNGFAPALHAVRAAEGEVGADGKGVAARSSERGGGGLHGTAAAAGGGVPGDAQIDAAVATDQAKHAAPAPRNPASAGDPVAKAFPESWREDLAGGDKAFRKTLDRFDNPAALAKAYKELTARLSSGDLKATRPPPDNATAEQIALWRGEQGLPQSAAAYVEG